MFNVPAFLDSLQYMAKGMTGVFLVIAAIILSIYLLNRVFKENGSGAQKISLSSSASKKPGGRKG